VPVEITARRDVVVTLTVDPEAVPPKDRNLQGLIDELVALAARPAIGGEAIVASITGGVGSFRLTVTKPD
jgi:hypothetical protein